MTRTTRRLLLVACTAALAALRAEADGPKRRVAVLGGIPRAEAKPYLDALLDGLREFGWIEGQNLIVDARYTNGDPLQLPAATAQLLALKPDVFLAPTDYAAKAAVASANSIPIVFALGSDPVGIGMVNSLAHPGTRSTGFSAQLIELLPKRLALLKEALPNLATCMVLEYRGGEPNAQAANAQLYAAARALGIELLHMIVNTPEDLERAFENLARQGGRGFIGIPHLWFFQAERIQQLAKLALKYRMATCHGAVAAVEAGLLMSYSVDYIALYRRCAKLVDRIFRGTDPADIPVEQANVYELVLNQRTARAINITFPYSLLLQATRVIG